MLDLNKGIDITNEIGGIATIQSARKLFAERLDAQNLKKLEHIQNEAVCLRIANAIAMCDPEMVFVHTGSEEDRQFVRELALKNGEEEKLPMDGHTVHFDLPGEQGRIIDRTYYIVNPGETVSSLAQKMERADALEDIRGKMQGIKRKMTMIIGFYMRGPIGSPVSNPALEITSSAYVAHSADILYRHAYACFDREVHLRGHFYTNIHSQGQNRPEDLLNARVFMDRSWRTTFSINCTYAGNTLLLKKGNHRFSVDKAVSVNRGKELSEHMFITGVEGTGGRVTWIAGAAPSGCGKTTTAMAGSHFVGDDLAQMWIDANGAVQSINPECGIFGIVEDVNREGDPYLMERLRKPGTEVIWSNVLIDEDGVPHWTGHGEEAPTNGFNFQGKWRADMHDASGKPVPMSHPNSRCTLSASALKNYAAMAEDPAGVETRVITYSGRDSDTMPPVWVASTPEEGVVIGACIVSAATATEVGARGVRRAPWANAPFIPGSLADYMDAQFRFFASPDIAADKRPLMAGLNYFLTDAARGGTSPKLLGEKRDVKVWLAWLEKRAHGEIIGISTPIGDVPGYDDLKGLFASVIDKPYPRDLYLKQFSLYIDNIVARIDLQLEAYAKEADIPATLFRILKQQRSALLALRKIYGPVVTPQQLEAYAQT